MISALAAEAWRSCLRALGFPEGGQAQVFNLRLEPAASVDSKQRRRGAVERLALDFDRSLCFLLAGTNVVHSDGHRLYMRRLELNPQPCSYPPKRVLQRSTRRAGEARFELSHRSLAFCDDAWPP